jgi:hypothetical protein
LYKPDIKILGTGTENNAYKIKENGMLYNNGRTNRNKKKL